MRLLYAHSYQSRAWNRVASRRIKDLSSNDGKAILGDLYFPQCPTLTTGRYTFLFIIVFDLLKAKTGRQVFLMLVEALMLWRIPLCVGVSC